VTAVVDTNVIAYLLLGTPQYVDEAKAFVSSLGRAKAPGLWEAELANVVWMAARHNLITIDDAIHRLTLAAALQIETVPNRALWQGALLRAHQSGIAVYDTLFVELAAREGIPLATFDKALLKAFPKIAARPAALTKK